jgi:hypothetical protein
MSPNKAKKSSSAGPPRKSALEDITATAAASGLDGGEAEGAWGDDGIGNLDDD